MAYNFSAMNNEEIVSVFKELRQKGMSINDICDIGAGYFAPISEMELEEFADVRHNVDWEYYYNDACNMYEEAGEGDFVEFVKECEDEINKWVESH
jgi:hypothetical protein